MHKPAFFVKVRNVADNQESNRSQILAFDAEKETEPWILEKNEDSACALHKAMYCLRYSSSSADKSD
eukprot:m.456106 g.456106  ORF g.456106 m.456106 type:complete len:67 (+) comp56972_c0_seq14:1506-1706(+)